MSDKPTLSVVHTMYDSNLLDVPGNLRRLADRIQAGEYGDVGCCAISLLADELHVFGFGPDSASCAAGMVLHAGFNQVSRAIEEHGK